MEGHTGQMVMREIVEDYLTYVTWTDDGYPSMLLSMESASRRPGPPPASSLAAPPEFYADENTFTRSVRRLLTRLGYVLRSPAPVPQQAAPSVWASSPTKHHGGRGSLDAAVGAPG